MDQTQRQALLETHGTNMRSLREMRAGSVLGAAVGGRNPELPTNPGRTGRSLLTQDNAKIRSVLGRQFE